MLDTDTNTGLIWLEYRFTSTQEPRIGPKMKHRKRYTPCTGLELRAGIQRAANPIGKNESPAVKNPTTCPRRTSTQIHNRSERERRPIDTDSPTSISTPSPDNAAHHLRGGPARRLLVLRAP